MKILITSPVEHDGKRLPLDKVVDLPDDAALALVAAGVAERLGKGRAADDTEKV
jgi:hypothetical protein